MNFPRFENLIFQKAFIRFNVVDVASNGVTAQRVVPVTKLKPGYR